jgi:hypothetical protein
MSNYINYKPPLIAKQGWTFWSTPDFKAINPDSNQIAALLFINKKKKTGIIFRPAPVINTDGKLLGIIENMLKEWRAPAIIKIDGKEVGLCLSIQNYNEIHNIFCPEIPLQAIMVKDTEWEEAAEKIPLVILPALAFLPFRNKNPSTPHALKKNHKKTHKVEQAKVNDFFHHYPTPSRVEIIGQAHHANSHPGGHRNNKCAKQNQCPCQCDRNQCDKHHCCCIHWD